MSKAILEKPKAKTRNPAPSAQKPRHSLLSNSPISHIHHLQRTIGNQAVQRLIQTKMESGSNVNCGLLMRQVHLPEKSGCSGSCSACRHASKKS